MNKIKLGSRGRYTWFGILFGVAFPVAALEVEMIGAGTSFGGRSDM